jgi:hypothetical protein
MHEQIKRRLNSGNACYHLVQSLLSSCLLSKDIKVKIYKTIILPFVLYGCETWSLTVREEHTLRVFENRMLRISGSKRDEATGEWRKWHDGELHNLYSSPNITRQIKTRTIRWAGYVAYMGEERKMYKVSMGKAKGNRPLGSQRCRILCHSQNSYWEPL